MKHTIQDIIHHPEMATTIKLAQLEQLLMAQRQQVGLLITATKTVATLEDVMMPDNMSGLLKDELKEEVKILKAIKTAICDLEKRTEELDTYTSSRDAHLQRSDVKVGEKYFKLYTEQTELVTYLSRMLHQDEDIMASEIFEVGVTGMLCIAKNQPNLLVKTGVDNPQIKATADLIQNQWEKG